MKGSDKWGQGGGPRLRIEVILAALVVVSLIGVYVLVEGSALNSSASVGKVTTISTTGFQCNDDSMPQAAQAVEQNTAFTSMSQGLCYNYLGESQGVMTFAYYNGTIVYPCGDVPLQPPASEIIVNTTATLIANSVQLLNSSQVEQPRETCGPSLPLDVVSVTDVESTIPAVPQLNVTLVLPAGGSPVSSVRAVLTVDGGSQTFRFGSVSPAGVFSSTEIILSNLSFNADEVYPMAVSGTYDDGQGFSYLVHVEIAQIP